MNMPTASVAAMSKGSRVFSFGRNSLSVMVLIKIVEAGDCLNAVIKMEREAKDGNPFYLL